jgi:hypothetical protein
MDRRRGQRWLLQGEPFDRLPERVGEAPLTPVASFLASQPGESFTSILAGPALGGAKRQTPVTGYASQWAPLFQGWAEELEPLECQGAFRLRKAD